MYLETMTEFLNFVESQRRLSKKYSLEKMYYYCQLFDHPENDFRSIHIGGTNGKGSVVAYMRHILKESGYKVATYTSPYVVCFNERITFDGKYISDEDCLKYANIILSKYPQIEKEGYEFPSFFEFITLLAFLYFRDCEDLDFALIEVGLGGLLDATNVITPLLSIITTISFDHMNVLGNTLAEIAENKLGIVKTGIPLISGIKDDKLRKQFVKHTKKKKTSVTFTDFDQIKVEKMDLHGSIFAYKNETPYVIKMLGAHQIENAALALEAIKYLNENGIIDAPDNVIRNGLEKTSWPGRAEIVHRDPLIILDGGHNLDGITRMCEFINSFKKNHYVRGVFAVAADKDKEVMIKKIDDTFDEIIFTEFSYKRSDHAYHLYELSNHPKKQYHDDIKTIIDKVIEETKPINVFLGSLYFVSEVRQLLKDFNK